MPANSGSCEPKRCPFRHGEVATRLTHFRTDDKQFLRRSTWGVNVKSISRSNWISPNHPNQKGHKQRAHAIIFHLPDFQTMVGTTLSSTRVDDILQQSRTVLCHSEISHLKCSIWPLFSFKESISTNLILYDKAYPTRQMTCIGGGMMSTSRVTNGKTKQRSAFPASVTFQDAFSTGNYATSQLQNPCEHFADLLRKCVCKFRPAR